MLGVLLLVTNMATLAGREMRTMVEGRCVFLQLFEMVATGCWDGSGISMMVADGPVTWRTTEVRTKSMLHLTWSPGAVEIRSKRKVYMVAPLALACSAKCQNMHFALHLLALC